MRTEQEMYNLILDYAERDPRVRGVLLNGSRANPAAPLDRFRDFDIVYLVTSMWHPIRRGTSPPPPLERCWCMQRTTRASFFPSIFPAWPVT